VHDQEACAVHAVCTVDDRARVRAAVAAQRSQLGLKAANLARVRVRVRLTYTLTLALT